MKRRLAILAFIALIASQAAAQTPVVIRGSNGVEKGTAGNPLRVDPTGSTTQPVSAVALPLPSGASTATLQGVVDADDASIVTGQTVALSGALNQAYDGSVWRRLTFGPAGTASTQVWTVQGIAGMTKLLVTPDSVALPANQSVNVSQINGVTPLMGNGGTGTGSQRVTIASDNTAFSVNASLVAATTGGDSTCYITSAASTNATNCKASAGTVHAIHVTNTTTTNYFLRMYDASGAPTCSSATGFVETVPALGAPANGGVNGRAVAVGELYSSGIGFCLTGGGSSTDNTNAATGVYVSIKYK